MTLYAYRCECGETRDVRHARGSTAPVVCPCGQAMRRDWRSIQLSPSATPTRRNQNPTRATVNNSWERGIVTVPRGDGRVPLLNPDGTPVRTKQYAENRHAIEAHQRMLANSTAPLT